MSNVCRGENLVIGEIVKQIWESRYNIGFENHGNVRKFVLSVVSHINFYKDVWGFV